MTLVYFIFSSLHLAYYLTSNCLAHGLDMSFYWCVFGQYKRSWHKIIWLVTLILTSSSNGLPSERRLQAPNQAREYSCLRRVCYYWPLSNSNRGEFTNSAPLQNSVLQGLRPDSNAADSSKRDLGGGLDSSVHSDGILQHLWRPRHVSLIHVIIQCLCFNQRHISSSILKLEWFINNHQLE